MHREFVMVLNLVPHAPFIMVHLAVLVLIVNPTEDDGFSITQIQRVTFTVILNPPDYFSVFRFACVYSCLPLVPVDCFCWSNFRSDCYLQIDATDVCRVLDHLS